ncbi:AAA family ATPase [Arcanobacterium hippocoleae]
MTSKEVEDCIRIANSQKAGFLPTLPHLPVGWSFSDELWQQTTEEPPIVQTVVATLSDWVREGLATHKAGDSCQFCGGTVSAQRLKDIENAIRQAEVEAPALVKQQLGECRSARSALRDFKTKLDGVDLSSSIYSEDLPAKKAEVLLETQSVLSQLEVSEDVLNKRVKNPLSPVHSDKPNVDFSALQEKFKALEDAHSEAHEHIDQHERNKERAVDRLKRHCCATDGSGWDSAEKALKVATQAKNVAINAEHAAKTCLENLKRQVSTTAYTAEFLDKSLSLILWDRTLRVSEGNTGEGYRITRHDEKAEGMSEGEKQLVSLLYFCAEFLTEDRKQSLKNSVVIFDDLGSQLDDARLLAVDRFISNHFQNPKPAALVYFTHSHNYLKILQSRLADKAVPRRNQEPRKAIFYEVYKDGFNSLGQSTRWRQWDDTAVGLTNDYWLSFYMVLRAFEELQNGNPPELGTGNFCRKVLEGFTEFRAPSSDNFGSRMDAILAQGEFKLSPALSRIVNNLSHTDLNRSGGVLSRNEIEVAVIHTLNFLRIVDTKHFNGLLVRFRSKERARALEADLVKRTGGL